MKKVLVINASARTADSKSRKLTTVFVDHWKGIHDDPVIRFRELGNGDIPHINENWVAAALKPAAARSQEEISVLATSDRYVSELREADVIVIGSPMYNWSIPSTLKAYIDHILRVNETFKVDRTNAQHPYIGLLQDKTLVLLLSRGLDGYEQGEHNAHMNFQSTYLKTVFNMMGISDIHLVAVNGTATDNEQLQRSIATARQTINDLVTNELI